MQLLRLPLAVFSSRWPRASSAIWFISAWELSAAVPPVTLRVRAFFRASGDGSARCNHALAQSPGCYRILFDEKHRGQTLMRVPLDVVGQHARKEVALYAMTPVVFVRKDGQRTHLFF